MEQRSTPPQAGFLLQQGISLGSYQLSPIDDLRHPNDADGYKSWLAQGIEELGRDVAADVEPEWMVPLLVE